MSDHVSSYLRSTPPPDGFVPVDSWRSQAACFEHPRLKPETWDDSNGHETDKQRVRRIRAATAVCDTCPVRLPCLADVDLHFDEGVRGGIDLRSLRRPRKKAMPA